LETYFATRECLDGLRNPCDRAQRRMRAPNDSANTHTGGRAKYLLSGLLRCDSCGAYYIGVNATEYGCSSHRDGGPCSNAVRLRREVAERVLLDPIRKELIAPERAARMAKEMHEYFLERTRAMRTRVVEVPLELQDLCARIERLRERLKHGDPDMPADEIQAAVDRAESKRRELEEQGPAARRSAKILTMLPRAAEAYRREITQGLAGNQRAALKARVILQQLFGGEIRLVPNASGGLAAH
jgi:site-specific DNA recombinase